MTDHPYCVSIIPARGGSKRIPGKNLLPLLGQPLVVHSVKHARAASSVREVIVSTDDPDIERVCVAAGAEVMRRPSELAGDHVTSEAVLEHVLDARTAQGRREPDLIVFLQATSPVRRRDDIDRAVAQLVSGGFDSVFSATENNRLIWAVKDGVPYSVTYDFHRRQREQDMAVQFRENGSIYVLKPEILRAHGNRLGGRIGVYQMDYWSSFQIDAPEHVELCRWILARPEFRPAISWPEPVSLVIFDFDGVMTDNAVWLDEEGNELVRCNRADGWGIGELRALGVPIMVLTTEARPLAARRCAKLKIRCVHSVPDKAAYLQSEIGRGGFDLRRVVYVGNDVNDLPAMRLVGLTVAVADAHPRVLEAAALRLSERGGFGAVREFCDLLSAHLLAPGRPVP